MLLGNVKAPNLNDGSRMEDQLRRVLDYMIQVQKQIDFALQNLGQENLDKNTSSTLKSVKTMANEMDNKLSSETFNVFAKKNSQDLQGKVSKGDVKNDLTTTVAGKVLDARQGKVLRDMIYPVGSVYISTTDTSPVELFGGTWEQIEGRFLLAAGGGYEPGALGGEATHTLNEEEMPKHHHTGLYETNEDDEAYSLALGTGTAAYKLTYTGTGGSTTSGTGLLGETKLKTGSCGDSQPHNNMPPYVAVYIWKRTA